MTCRRWSDASVVAEDGAAGLLTMLLALLAVTAGVAGLAVTLDVAMTSARARTAADAAALAAAATSPLVAGTGTDALPGDPAAARAAAVEVSRANGARLNSIDLRRWPLQVAVRVAVAPRTQLVRGLVGMSEAGATAAVRPPAVAPPAV